ncbi:CMP-N,N'-diacetyllegionaminic acid synthase [Phycisphaerae bacterium RAS1]|nr:CMP-N,N'-diacetyllegionaminic acid synthase [Phycisphaerae bacterium RAS1]
MTIVGIIPARSGSKRLPGKNLAPLGGQPLIRYTCDAALASGALDAIYVNTDSREIADVAESHGISSPVLRPEALARDDTPTRDANIFLLDFLQRRGECYDAVMVLQPTSPFRTPHDISAAVALYEANRPCAVVSMSPVGPAGWLGRVGRDGRLERLDGEDVIYRLNGAIYLYSCIDYRGGAQPPRTLVYAMPAARGVDIDTPEDLQHAECVIQQALHV